MFVINIHVRQSVRVWAAAKPEKASMHVTAPAKKQASQHTTYEESVAPEMESNMLKYYLNIFTQGFGVTASSNMGPTNVIVTVSLVFGKKCHFFSWLTCKQEGCCSKNLFKRV